MSLHLHLWNEHFNQRSGERRSFGSAIQRDSRVIHLYFLVLKIMDLFFCWQSKESFMSPTSGSFAHQVCQENSRPLCIFSSVRTTQLQCTCSMCIINDESNLRLHHISRTVLHMPFSIHTHSLRTKAGHWRCKTLHKCFFHLFPVYLSLPKKGGIPWFWGAWEGRWWSAWRANQWTLEMHSGDR